MTTMETDNNNEFAAVDADPSTDNSYASSSGSDTDESNTSLLERNSILSEKFMLPKDLCENGTIFDEFFSPTLWDSLPPSARQHLAQFLPISSDERSSASKLVHDLLLHRLERFGNDQMTAFKHNLAEGNFRTDIAKLRRNLGKSLQKERRILALQRAARLAQNVVLAREATLLAELHTNGASSISPTFLRKSAPFGYRKRWTRHQQASSESNKYRILAKKRYLSEIVSVSEATRIPLSVSDEEDCLEAIPTGPLRKQRRMFGAGPQVSNEHSQLHQRQGPMIGNGTFFGSGGKRGTAHGSAGASANNVIDGTSFNTPKLFVVTDEHYQRLLMQYRKRKIEEPDHPELDLSGVKLKDVVSRTQIAAGYRRILPLPKVHLPEPKIESTLEGNEKIRSLKSIKTSRLSYDKGDMYNTVCSDSTSLDTKDIVPKLEKQDDDSRSSAKLEQNSNSTTGLLDVKAELNPSVPFCKEENDTSFKTSSLTPKITGSAHVDHTEGKSMLSSKKLTNQNLPDTTPPSGSAVEEGSVVPLDFVVGSDTHACFLSVVRDLFCSHPDHRSTTEELQRRLDAWSKSSSAARNSWYKEYQSYGEWHVTLLSAVQFLAGEFQNQPEDFVPYIEHKVALNILQWIGASRDGDSRLVPLCAYWQSRKQEMGLISSASHAQAAGVVSTSNSTTSVSQGTHTPGGGVGALSSFSTKAAKNVKTNVNSKLLLLSSNSSSSSSSSFSSISSMTTVGDGSSLLAEAPVALSMSTGAMCSSQDDDGSVSERSVSPPPPRFPTDWSVRKATEEEVLSFREQEKRRYENPHMAFTYKQHSYDSVVGPVKGIYTQVPGISKARGHSMLVADRPNFVTILTLVRDATARLPNGEGTRADICELLKSSQYISPTATDQILQTIVSGALDRMHTEHDPCVKYDAKRKIWIYLHRNRTEEEFERLHLQYQGFTKHKKTVTRKPVRCHKESIPSSSRTAKGASVEGAGLYPVDTLSSASLEQEGSDLSSSMTNVANMAEISSPTGGITTNNNNTTILSPAVVVTPSVKSATSLLKKQSPSMHSATSLLVSERKADDTTTSTGSPTRKIAVQQEQSKHSVAQPPQIVSSDVSSEPNVKLGTKTSGAVTLITSTGSSVKTIKIPKSSLSLSGKPANAVATSLPTAGTGTAVDKSASVENVVSSYITLPQKNVLLSSFGLSSAAAKSTPGTATIVSTLSTPNTKVLPAVLRKVSSIPIVMQSAASSTASLHCTSTPSLASSSVEADSKVQPGGSVLSIRQVNSTSTGSTVVVGSNASSANEHPAPAVSSQILLHTKPLQMPMLSNATIVSSAGGSIIHPGSKVATSIISVTTPQAKPIFTTSTGSGSAHIKSLPASVASSLLPHSTSPSSGVPSTGSTLPQRVVVSSGLPYSTASSSPGVAIKPAGTVNSAATSATATIMPTSATHRVVRPSANLISTITLGKGQQSVLTPAQQKQILQNLLSQQQKQMLAGKKLVATAAPDQTQGDSTRAGETLHDGAQSPTISTFKLQHHANASPTFRALSPQIVKITPARAPAGATSSSVMVGNGAGNATTTLVSSVSPLTAQAVPAGVKMVKVHPSSILTSTGTHTVLPSGTIGTGNVVAVSAASSPGATMRVLKTATGTTTVIKTGVPGTPTATQLSPQTSNVHHAIAKLRKDASTPLVSKVTVTPNVSGAAQLIPLESLLQKQGTVGSTFLKIAGTSKTGQPQILQFSTNTTNVSGSALATSNVSPMSTVGSGHQYTVLTQGARNIISVTPNTAGTGMASRATTNLPVTIVSSEAATPHAAGSSSTTLTGTPTAVSVASSGATLLSQQTSGAVGKLQQAGKIKLFASPSSAQASAIAASTIPTQPQGTIISPKTPMASSTVIGGTGGEFLNAKIIGVRNVTSAKVKGASPLSIMNASNLNIAHIGGKPIIIANSSTLTANPTVTVSTTGIGSGSNNQTTGNNNAGTGAARTMLLTSNANYTTVLPMDQTAKGKQGIMSASVTTAGSREGGPTGTGSSSNTIVSGQPGHTQTLMLGNQLVKVQTIQTAAAGKLAQQKLCLPRQTVQSDGGSAPRETGTTAATNAILTTAGGCTVVQQQPQQQPFCSTTPNNAPNVPKAITVTSSAAAVPGGGSLSKSIVKIQPGNSGTANAASAAKIIEVGQPKAQAQSQRVVLATSSGQLLTQPIILPSGFQTSGPINIKRLKVIPVSKQNKQ